MKVRLFELERIEDESGVSGTGIVAQGIQFENGWCALSWLTEHTSVAFYTSIEEVVAIHGHNGKTKVVVVFAGNTDSAYQAAVTASQDEYENIGCEFTTPNQRSVWDERAALALMFHRRNP